MDTGLDGFKRGIRNTFFGQGGVEGQKSQAERLLEKVDPHIRRHGNTKELLDLRNSVTNTLNELGKQYSEDLKNLTSETKSETTKELNAKLALDSFNAMTPLFEAVKKTQTQWEAEMATRRQSHAKKPDQPFQPLEDVKTVLRGLVTIAQPCTSKIERLLAADLEKLELCMNKESLDKVLSRMNSLIETHCFRTGTDIPKEMRESGQELFDKFFKDDDIATYRSKCKGLAEDVMKHLNLNIAMEEPVNDSNFVNEARKIMERSTGPINQNQKILKKAVREL